MSSVADDVDFYKSPQDTISRQYLTRHWQQLIKGLGKRDARFVPIRKGQKLPSGKGWNKTENTIGAADALAHLATGGNVGHAGGTGNLYEWDLDRNVARGYDCSYLEGGLVVARANAPDKAKFFFTCDDLVPTRPRSKKHGFDLIGVNANGTHAQGVIAGIHPTGDPYRWSGHTIPHLHIDIVAEIFEGWTDGEELFPTYTARSDQNVVYTSADLARVADALQHVDPNDMDYNSWIGIIAAIHDAFGDDALYIVEDWADGKAGEVESKWHTFDREYTGRAATIEGLFTRARKAGWADTWTEDHLASYRVWLASPEAFEALKEATTPAPDEVDPDRTKKLFRNPERARKLLDSILEKCEKGKCARISPGYAYLAKQAGIAKGAIGGYLAKLFAGGFLNLQVGAEDKPTVIELVFHNLNSYYPNGEAVQVVKNWNIYREFRADEAFLNNHASYSKTHLRPALQPFGDNGLGALLALLDGPATTQEAADTVGYSYGAMARVLRRFADRGVVSVTVGDRNRKTYTLADEWRAIIDADRPHMPTCGVLFFRNVEMLRNRVKQLRKRGQDQRADLLEQEYKRLDDIASNLRQALCIVPFEWPMSKRERKMKRLRHAHYTGERAQSRPAFHSDTEEHLLFDAREFMDKYRRMEYAIDRKMAGENWPELSAWAQVVYGDGWWMHKDEAQIIQDFRAYKRAGDFVPTVHWAGEMAVAA